MTKSLRDHLDTKLEQFAASFKEEADLRIALIALLEKMPSTSGLRHTHGVGEKGKDIVFNFPGPFGREELIGCVVKPHAITGSVDSDKGARTVFHQAEQVLDTPIPNSRGEEEYPSRVFVITPYECSTFAIESIKGKLSKPDGVVKFICGRELYDLFERYYPDYLVFRSGLFGSYISDLEAGLSTSSAISNLLIKHGLSGPSVDISKLYVQPSLAIEIRKHYIFTEWPDLIKLPSPISEDEIDSWSRNFRAFGLLMNSISVDAAADAIQETIAWIMKKLRADWKGAFKEYWTGRTSWELSERAVRRDVRVEIPGLQLTNSELQTKIGTYKEAFTQFQHDLEAANVFAESQPSTLSAFLVRPNRYSYSYIRGIAIQQPLLFPESALVESKIITDAKDLLASGEDVLITAPAGFGKTSFCMWNVLNDIRNLKDSVSNVIPVFIALHELSVTQDSTAEDTFLASRALTDLWMNRRSTRAGAVVRRFRFYLDGLDEVPDRNKQSQVIRLAKELKAAEPSTQLVITGREHIAGAHLKGLTRLHVSQMDDSQVDQLLCLWFVDSTDRKHAFSKQLESLPSLKQIIRIPLLATLVLSVYESTAALPESRNRLYDMFISLMAGGWDMAKRVHRGTIFGSQPKITVLQYLAGRLQISESRDFTFTQFSNAVRHLLPALKNRAEDLLQEVLQDGLLIPVSDGYAFSHLSFQEYLAAKDLVEPKGRRAAEALGGFLRGNDWWKEVMSFYVGFSGPKEMEQFVRSEAISIARKTFDQQILNRTRYLLGEIQRAFPGAEPDFKFPDWPKSAFQTKSLW